MTTEARNLARAESKELRLFLIWASLVATLCVTSGFLGMVFHTRGLIREEMLNSARHNFAAIVVMRRWNAEHGGVYVLKRPGVDSNPYLENPDVTAVDGKVYTLRNPAVMTREISELLQQEEGFFARMTSLRPLNPNNQPDDPERAALESFEKGKVEAVWEQDIGGVPHFRFMAPLRVEASCLDCHAKQGYRLGDVRGGVSISLPMSQVQDKLQRNSLIIVGLAVLTVGLIMTFVGMFFRRLVGKLGDARVTLNRMATTDPLTGLANRHTLFQRLSEEYERHRRSGHPLSIAMIDVDHFKRVNDTYGHAAGDAVLQDVARHIQASVRQYDIAARFGGEEFLILLPGSDLAMAQQGAERIRKTIEERVHAGSDQDPCIMTVSLGVASLGPGEAKEALIQRADAALYRAKAEGRNRVVCASSAPGQSC